MEYSQTEVDNNEKSEKTCLNPYSNGILTDTLLLQHGPFRQDCLNPYSNGILTDHSLVEVFYQPSFVLILILMEYSQTQ